MAKWDGDAWSPLGDGLEGAVYALAVFDDGSGDGPALYACGGLGAVRYFARWDGASWHAVGDGFDNIVEALVVFDDGLVESETRRPHNRGPPIEL